MSAIADRLRGRLTDLVDRHATLGIAMDAARGFGAHEASLRASAIAYYTVLSLPPFAFLAASLGSLLLGEGPQLDAVVDQVAVALSVDREVVRGSVLQLAQARGVLAVAGLGLLVLALLPWGQAVQQGIVTAFGEERRSFLRATLGSVAVLGLAAILILLSGAWASIIGLALGLLDRWLVGVPILDLTSQLLLSVLPGLVVLGVMVVLLRVVPVRRPSIGDVWPGALLTALVFLALRFGFDLYVALFVADRANAAGPLGVIVVGLIYVQLLAVAILAGAELAAARFHRRIARSAERKPAPG